MQRKRHPRQPGAAMVDAGQNRPSRGRCHSALWTVVPATLSSVLVAVLTIFQPAEAQERSNPLARVASDFGSGLRGIADDAWHVVTFPRGMETDDWLVMAGVLGAGGFLYVYDGEIQEGVRGNDGKWLHDAVAEVGDFFEPIGLMGNTNVFYAGGVAVGYLSGWTKLEQVSRDLLISHWLSAATYNPIRDWIGRARPNTGLGPRNFEGGTSMPSGHSSTIVQVASVLSHHIGWRPASIVLHALAGTVLFQRLHSDQHWASDVWIGAAWGWGVSKIILSNQDRRRGANGEADREESNARISLFPVASRNGSGLGLRVSLGGL